MANYILDEQGKPIREPDLLKFGRWFETGNRRVASDYIGNVFISTVFLGIDHSFHVDGPPILYETMIFGGDHDQYQDRYSTKEEAIAGHKKAVALVEKKT